MDCAKFDAQQGVVLWTLTVPGTCFILAAPSVDPFHPDYVPSIFAHKNTTTDG